MQLEERTLLRTVLERKYSLRQICIFACVLYYDFPSKRYYAGLRIYIHFYVAIG